MEKKKIIRISTVPQSLNVFLKGQLKMLSEHYEVVAVSSPGKDLEELKEREGIRTIGIPIERKISIIKDIVSLIRLISLFHKEKPYAVHSMCGKAELLGMAAAWISRVPVRINTFTGASFTMRKGFMKFIMKSTTGLTCFFANYLNPEGHGVEKVLNEAFHPKKGLHVIGNGNIRGIDMEYYSRSVEVCKKAQEYTDKNTITFCFVGRVVKDKGINELVEAFDRLSKEFRYIRLFIIGPYEENLDPISPITKQTIKENNSIILFGSQSDVRPFLAASDIYVFPSYREGMPNSLIEAGAMGLPSIVTDIMGSNEIILNKVNGEIIPSQDTEALYNKMKDWLKNPEKVQIYAQNSRKLIDERFEIKNYWKCLLNVYKQLIPTF